MHDDTPNPATTDATAPAATAATTSTSDVVLRPATPSDAAAIIELYEGLTAQSRYTRFFMPTTARLSSSLRNSLTDLRRSTVWLAFDGQRCVGEARITTSERQDCAELAVTVADSHQGRGLGSRLSSRVIGDYLANGGCASFTILPTNEAAARLARRGGGRLHFDGDHLAGRIVAPAAR